MKHWYLIHSKPRQERIALENLQRQGYESYLPLMRERRRRRGRIVKVIGPMFPRYLFIYLSDETDDWRPIRSTLGVASLVRFGQLPAVIPDNLVAALKRREDGEGIQVLPEATFRTGDRVRIAEGPFQGYEAIFQAHSGRERVILLLEIARHTACLELGVHEIEPLG
jgi:transcriptional antiterminator RfaH